MSRRRPPRFSGLLPVAKTSGPTSHDVVDKARRALKERRIGHTGTLDPMAEGLLLLCVGHATRLQQYLLGWHKTYHGIVRLGFATTTSCPSSARRSATQGEWVPTSMTMRAAGRSLKYRRKPAGVVRTRDSSTISPPPARTQI